MRKFKNFIKESPDFIVLNKLKFRHHDEGAFPFGYFNDKMKVGTMRRTHSTVFDEEDKKILKDYEYEDDAKCREDLTFSGRIWLDVPGKDKMHNIISFWDYPDDYNQLKEVLKDLEETFNKKHTETIHITDDWLIEVIMINDEQIINKYIFWGVSEIGGDERYLNNSVLIRVGDYKGSEKRSEEQLKQDHMEIGSGGKDTPEGFGSKYNKKLPKGMSQAEYKNKTTKYKYTESILNESPDYVAKYSLNLNDGLPFSYYDGSFNSSNFGYTHDDLLYWYERSWEGDEEMPDLQQYEKHNGRGEKSGRLFPKHKLITFWKFPKDNDEMKEIADDIKWSTGGIDGGIDIWKNGWEVEILKDGNLTPHPWEHTNDNVKYIPVEDFERSTQRSEEELKQDHIKVGKGGNIKGLGSRYHDDKLPKGMSQAEYKNKKTKYKYTESIQSVQFTYNKELSPKFWQNDIFDQRIREKILTIANEFYNDLKFDVKIDDILLVGSLCNFNYNKYSDLDVHIVVDFGQINEDKELVENSVDALNWNLQHDIKFKGHDIELYIQDIDSENISGGIYSLMNNEWITKPKYDEPNIEKDLINFKFLTYKSGIDRLEKMSFMLMSPEVATKNYNYVKKYKKKIKSERQSDLEKGGEFSVGNIVFKKLRNSGDYGRLIDITTRLYDKIYSE